MIIAVDCGVLGISDNRLKVGVYHFVYNLLKALSALDKKNQYLLYSFFPIEKTVLSQFGKNFKNKVLLPQKGWLTLRLSLEFLLHKQDIFLGLSQALPLYHPKRNIIYIYDLAFELYPEFYKESFKRLSRQTKFVAKYSDKIIAVSKSTKNDLVRLYKANPAKIKVIYHGVDERFQPASGTKGTKVPYFLFVGSYKPSKNIPNIIKAFNLFIKSFKKPYQLVLAGSNYWGDSGVTRLIGDLDLGSKVKIAGFVQEDDLPELYRGATAFVSPSFYEGFGMPFLEAMICGVPVIASPRGSIPEIVGDAALLVDPDNTNGLKEAMMKVATDEKLRNQMIAKGLKQAQKFSWQKSADKLLKIINKL